jgi:phosphatidylethanolamine-binding protein (PEBP) family uncharacterized protein
MLTGIVLVPVLIFAGCGGSSTTTGASSSRPPALSTSTPTAVGAAGTAAAAQAGVPTRTTDAGSEPLPALAVSVSVPVLLPGNLIPKLYTCDGNDLSLPVRWRGIPRSTAEIAVFIVNFQPVHGKLFFDWAVGGIKPTLHGLTAGTLPRDAVVGRNSFGKSDYSICPPSGKRSVFAVKVLPLPHALAARAGFDAEALYLEAERSVKVNGYAGAAYKRP